MLSTQRTPKKSNRSDIVVQRHTTSNKTEKTKNKQPTDEPSTYCNLSSLQNNNCFYSDGYVCLIWTKIRKYNFLITANQKYFTYSFVTTVRYLLYDICKQCEGRTCCGRIEPPRNRIA